MTLQLQAATSLWSAQSGRIGTNNALQQNAADPAENGNDLSADFAAAMAQSQTVQQQLAAAPADQEEEQEQVSTPGAGLNNGQSSQSVSGNSQTSGAGSKEAGGEQNSEQAQKFLDGLMEQLLANRLGLNKKEMDRLKEKIAELELKRKELMAQASQGGDSAKLTSAIAQMDMQISQLQKQLEQLIRENELSKNNPDDDKRREWSAQSLGQSLDQVL